MRKSLNSRILLLLSSIMFISMSTSIIINIVSINKISVQNNKTDNLVISSMVSNGIDNCFLRPITVSETMCQDFSLKQYLKRSGDVSPTDPEMDIRNYLKSIRDGFNYQMAFAVCDKSKAYYTYDGISKFVDPDKNQHDIWYKAFTDSKEHYLLDVDTDEVNGWNLSVFVNTAINDDDGTFLGIVGVGVEMAELQKLIAGYEERYKVKVNLVNSNGLIQIDTDGSRIERAFLDNSYFNQISDGEYFYERAGTGSRVTYYMENLGWYLVIYDHNIDNLGVEKIVTPSVLIFLIGILFMIGAAYIISQHEFSMNKELSTQTKMSLMDEMSKVYNRRSFEQDSVKLSDSDKLHKFTVVGIDINGLKVANDNYGHEAGDELIIGAAKCLKDILGKYGKIYRTGGDEFVALLEISKEDLTNAMIQLDSQIDKWHGKTVKELSISKGTVIASENPELTLDDMIKLADKLMYEDKKAYYERTGKERREE